MSLEPEFPLKIFYDGSCYVCSTGMSFYMGKGHGGRLEFIDISAPDFDPGEFGISPAEFMYQLHAIDRRGQVYRGPDAFSAIWLAFPSSSWYGFLAKLVTLPGIRVLARASYLAFARIRKYLPRQRKAACWIGKHPRQ